MQNAASIIMRIQHDLGAPTRRDMDTDSINAWMGVLRKLLPILEAYLAKEKIVQADRALSDEGKRQAMATAAAETIRSCRWMANVIDAYEEALAQQRTTLFVVASPEPDALLAYHRAREIRDDLRKLNPAQKSLAYVTASERDDRETMAALLAAPGGSWVSAEVKERADTERAKRLTPDAYAAFQQNVLMHELVAGLRHHVSLWALHTGVSQAILTETFGQMLEPGQPNGAPRVQGATWAQAVAVNQ